MDLVHRPRAARPDALGARRQVTAVAVAVAVAVAAAGGRRRRTSRGDEDDRGGAQRLRGVYRASVRYGAQGNETRRYGFITPAGLEPDTRTDVFMHADDVREGHIVKHGDSVEYTLVPCLRTGKERAADVVKLRFRSPELSLEGTIAARTKRILAGDHGIRAQFDDRTLTVRTLRAAVAKSLGVDAEQAAVKKVVKQTLMDALEAKARRPRGVFNLVPRGFKRFGFITPDGGGEDMFAHLENVRAGHVVEDRNAVEYGIGRGPDGRDQAADIVPVPSPPPPPSARPKTRRRGAGAGDRRGRPVRGRWPHLLCKFAAGVRPPEKSTRAWSSLPSEDDASDGASGDEMATAGRCRPRPGAADGAAACALRPCAPRPRPRPDAPRPRPRRQARRATTAAPLPRRSVSATATATRADGRSRRGPAVIHPWSLSTCTAGS